MLAIQLLCTACVLEVDTKPERVLASMSTDTLEAKTIKQKVTTKYGSVPLREDLIQLRGHEGPVRSIQAEMGRLRKNS